MPLFKPSSASFTTLSSTPKTILITGGSSGIGLATATLLSALNPSHTLILLDLQPPPPKFSHPASHTLYIKCNVTSWPSQRSAFEAAHKKFGRIDAVFVNAGIMEYRDQFFTDLLDSSGKLAAPDHRTLTVDLNAAVDSTKLAIHYLRKNGREGGSIVLTASVAGYLGFTGAPLYTAAKHGVVGLVRCLKGEVAKVGIAISCVAPGITVTPLLNAGEEGGKGVSPEEKGEVMAKAGVAVNRVESVALAVCYLLDAGRKANGAGILIQQDKFTDIERGLAKSRASWMTQEMLDDFRGGRGADVFDVPSKAKI
ncbi:hypothetical protein DPSP01_007793 [Paraphaeosphaeria sporulosa]